MMADRDYPIPPEGHRRPVEPAPYPAGYDRDGHDHDERSLGELFKELGRETRTLVRQEIQLAKSELGQIAGKAGKNAGFIAAGGFVAYAGFLALVISLGFLLGSFMPDWLGFLITGALVIAVGYSFVQKGRKGLKETNFSLERTTDSLKEDKQWLKIETQEIKDDPAHLGARR